MEKYPGLQTLGPSLIFPKQPLKKDMGRLWGKQRVLKLIPNLFPELRIW